MKELPKSVEKVARVTVGTIATQILLCFIPTIGGKSVFDTLQRAAYMVTEGEQILVTNFIAVLSILSLVSSAVTVMIRHPIPVLGPLAMFATALFHRIFFADVWEIRKLETIEMNIFGHIQLWLPIGCFIFAWIYLEEIKELEKPTDINPPAVIKKAVKVSKDMVTCPGCGQDVSDKANWCPHCSTYLNKS